jgi:hypothetical protein
MAHGAGPRDFEEDDVKEAAPSDNVNKERIEVWGSIKKNPKEFDLRFSISRASFLKVSTEKANKDSQQEGSEKIRQKLVYWLMGCLGIWILVGLIYFIATGNYWLLTTAGLLAIPLQRIFDHFFPRPKKK